jgi:hypothetical protein
VFKFSNFKTALEYTSYGTFTLTTKFVKFALGESPNNSFLPPEDTESTEKRFFEFFGTIGITQNFTTVVSFYVF